METLTEKLHICQALNFGKYPVLTLDLSKSDEYGLTGCECRVDMGKFQDGKQWLQTSRLRVFGDDCKPQFTTGGACLTNSWGYSDVMEDARNASLQVIKPNSEFVLIIHDSVEKEVYKVLILKTGDVKRHCSTPITCENFDLKPLMRLSAARYNQFEVKE